MITKLFINCEYFSVRKMNENKKTKLCGTFYRAGRVLRS